MKWLNDLSCTPNRDKQSLSRAMALAGFFVVTWILIHMELRESTQYELVIGYLTVVVAGEAVKRIAGRKENE